MPERLDEQSLRRPDFVEGSPVVLADQQTWHFRRPTVRHVPADTPIGFDVRVRFDDDGTFSRLWREMREAEEGPRAIATMLAAGRYLLLANYDLTADQVGDLIQFAFGEEDDPEGERIRDEVMAVVWGRGPKPSAGGGE